LSPRQRTRHSKTANGIQNKTVADGGSAALLSGIAFAYGYGVVGPVANTWASAPYPPNARARPIALVALSYQLGTMITAQLVGAVVPIAGWPGVLMILAGLAAAVILVMSGQIRARSDQTPCHRGTQRG
jgi:MFS family permease